jgi:hypothetical protein
MHVVGLIEAQAGSDGEAEQAVIEAPFWDRVVGDIAIEIPAIPFVPVAPE